ncbi:MAG: SBBP repeat-containing protein, partial [Myxococcota bacterium]|nr:SBBP repeat-containing protein [Myxococcota bacterium]
VACETVVSGLPRLTLGAGAPAASLGAPGDFYANEESADLYEKQTYSRSAIHLWASGHGVWEDDYSEQGNKLAVDSAGNIFIAAQTTGDFEHGVNCAPSNNTFDSLLIKFIP